MANFIIDTDLVPVGKTRYQEGRCVARLERTR
jgi:hypothetical protein